MVHEAGLVERAVIEAERAPDGAILDEADVEMIVGADPGDEGGRYPWSTALDPLGTFPRAASPERNRPSPASPTARLRWKSVPVQGQGDGGPERREGRADPARVVQPARFTEPQPPRCGDVEVIVGAGPSEDDSPPRGASAGEPAVR